ncbi:Oidioi.mRNA.OKI2018_I69.chr1.g1750.t1.cds [Oikopleura dioica]|uniref:Oidioi.mRNA.OKI2018_I69.chr1.g1750.t1.cds n=1 Tax=Oikopleura dioica TaxID=34765 RepID=A0ABN7SSC5_OIKDI|nr:Oidioi.mRNA.OKI2018_I69.chr1.g1750.t1.cds [Oikopleura dioica]
MISEANFTLETVEFIVDDGFFYLMIHLAEDPTFQELVIIRELMMARLRADLGDVCNQIQILFKYPACDECHNEDCRF